MADRIDIAVNKQQVLSDLKEIKKGVEEVGQAAQKASASEGFDDFIKKLDAEEAAVASAASLANMVAVLGGVTAAFAAAGAAGKAFMDMVKTASENGDADSQRLMKAIEGVGTAWTDVQSRMAEAPGMSNAIGWMESLTKAAGEAVRSVGHLGTHLAGSSMGLNAEETEKAVNKQLELNQSRKQMADVTKMLADFERRERIDALREENKKLESVEEVTAAIEEEKRKLKEKTTTQLADGTAIARSEERLNSLEQRKKHLIQETQEAKEKAARDAKKQAEEDERNMEQYLERDTKNRIQSILDSVKEEMRLDAEAKAARLKMEADYQKARQNILKGIGQDKGVQSVAQQVAREGADPRAVAKRLADDRADAAMSGITNGGQWGATGAERRQVEQIRQQAYRDAMQQMRGMPTSGMAYTPDQIQGAMQKNNQQILQNAAKNTNLSSETLDATGMLANEFQKSSADLDAMSAQVQTLKQQVAGTAQQNQRRRAQSGVSRP